MATSPFNDHNTRWSVVPNATLHWKIWDDQCVVYNDASGQTHLLDPIPALVIRQIHEGCHNSEALFDEVAKVLDVDLTSHVRMTFEQTLRRLDAAGLIEPTLP
jgi:PqqD family protein of HPr-rel-A system